jgi:hypothetical protein
MKTIFVSKQSVLTVLFLCVEQGIVASSTFWLVWLARTITNGTSGMLPFIGLICSLTLVYIPSTLKLTFLAKAKAVALERYIDLCAKGLYCVPHLSRSRIFQLAKRSFIETESFLVIDEVFDFANYSLGLGLNVVFNLSALCLAFGPGLFGAYVLSAAIGITFAIASSRRVAMDAAVMQKTRSEAYGTLTESWDSITLGNRYNFELWRNCFGKKIRGYKEKMSGAVFNLEMLTSLALWAAILPVAAFMADSMWNPATGLAVKTMILATFPRQIQVIQYIAEIVNSLLRLSAIKERYGNLRKAVHVGTDVGGMTGRINLKDILCVDAGGREFDLSRFEFPLRGRLTIRGANGSGKSTLLLEIKRRRPEQSIIIPAHSRLHFASVSEGDLSTGQKLVKVMDELCRQETLKLVCLDEWDANLDEVNMQKISAIIDQLAQRCCVVEIRHRKEAVC